MQILKEMELKLKDIWLKAQHEKDQGNKSKLLIQYFKMYQSYKLQKEIVEG